MGEIDHEILNHNTNIKESEALILKYEKQLDNVKNNREFDALTKEVELQKLEIQLSQKKIREANIARDTKRKLWMPSLPNLIKGSKMSRQKK